MIKVFSAQNFIEVAFWRNYLEQQGLCCFIKNEFSASAAGELPPIDCWPELWIEDDRDEALAKKYLASDPLGEQNLPAWTCSYCGEESDGQFSHCWYCEQERLNETMKET
ncbi:MAG: hypothetical protein CL866_00555 [Cycloclasticus sp.]|mgnify:FL=1|nr:hypothetical protein [Cycloclasticus sp.]MBG95348.1 hypothetical protein [Cycloclasticus sp.]|tara:strand:- start:520 stop:849 length:330 start_codon:yes stop_codon:yes gene_type:complete